MRPLFSPDTLWLAQGLATALVAGLGFALIVGLWLLIRPEALLRVADRLNHWVDTSEHFRKLERPVATERWVYRNHRWVGSAVTLGALLVLWQWVLHQPQASVRVLFAKPLPVQWDWAVPAIDTLIIVLHCAGLVVGLVIAIRPSLLKTVEAAANRWHQLPGAAPLDRVVISVDRGVALYPRLAGAVVTCAAAVSLIFLVPYLRQLLAG